MFFYTNAVQYGNRVLVRGIKNGYPFQNKEPFAPTLYVKSQKGKYRSMFGEALDSVDFSEINEAKDFIKSYEDVDNFEIFGNRNFAYQYISKTYRGEIQFSMDQIHIQSLDIETTSEFGFPNVNDPQEQILLITMQNYATKEIVTFGQQSARPCRENHTYHTCVSEAQLLNKFLEHWQADYPHVITGWNIELFDIPYLTNRIRKVLGDTAAKRLSPWGIVNDRSFERAGKSETKFELLGISTLDYLDLYKKFTYSVRESYRLDFIARVELGKNKLEYQYDSLQEFWQKDWQNFVLYNVIDVEIIDQLEAKMKLIELIITMAYDAKCNYNDIFSAVRTWDCLIYNHLQDQGVIVHQRVNRTARSIVGAYVQEPVPGIYHWVVSVDATSLYPSILMQYNMSPETLVEAVEDVTVDRLLDHVPEVAEGVCLTANGHQYSTEKQGYLPEIIQRLFDKRQQYKKKMIAAQKKYEETGDVTLQASISKYNNYQMAQKILLNSAYGALANEYFRLYDDRIAEGITLTGQFIIRSVGKAINEYLNKVCGTQDYMYAFYGDTDSVYITLDPLVEKFFKNIGTEKLVGIIDKFCNDKLSGVLDKCCEKLAQDTQAFQSKISFKRESIADRGIWAGKKRYALNVWDSEGVRYHEPKLKVMGLEIVRSSTPEPVRDALKEAVKIILNKDEKTLHGYIQSTEQKYMKLSYQDIAFPRSVNNMAKYTDQSSIYKQATPMHVRGSLLYNFYLKKNKLEKKFETIQEGDKIKFIYLQEPNPIGENCIAFNSKIPDQFGLTKYIDYDTMFEKSFIEPLNTILSGIGWSSKPKASLASLFG